MSIVFKLSLNFKKSSDEEEDEEGEETPKEKKNAASSESTDTTLDSSKEDTPDISKTSKSQKRHLKKKLQQQAKQPLVNGVDKAKVFGCLLLNHAKTAERIWMKFGMHVAFDMEKKKKQSQRKGKKKKELSGGVAIEDLKVYHVGCLKQNNKMFDNCVKGPGFKFRLGSKEVISGWDVGIVGVKGGGKRKIVCPSALASGAKGSPPVIPPTQP